ncbi:hypothetical protein K431DRAFT_330649 [Polychaeton citri CBS 116435]|uniref:Uncharacterized protein n=1 Tax=Polychaeton citri CBS 116435 TaxID=1314669 RepID=A0A9P4Q3K0_9PEZI|nr:hypothetical protein K431DRAFT_330649 [Polychaeton citri CBS 116435]
MATRPYREVHSVICRGRPSIVPIGCARWAADLYQSMKGSAPSPRGQGLHGTENNPVHLTRRAWQQRRERERERERQRQRQSTLRRRKMSYARRLQTGTSLETVQAPPVSAAASWYICEDAGGWLSQERLPPKNRSLGLPRVQFAALACIRLFLFGQRRLYVPLVKIQVQGSNRFPYCRHFLSLPDLPSLPRYPSCTVSTQGQHTTAAPSLGVPCTHDTSLQ